MHERGPVLALVAAALLQPGAALASDGFELSGSYKNLLVRSRSWDGQRSTSDLNRLRLALKGQVSDALSIDVQHDIELLLQHRPQASEFRQRLHRASANLAIGDADVRIGRQRIAWGTGRFWSPLDLLNPVSPIAIERDQRLGTDAVLLEHKFGPLSRATVVHAPARRRTPEADALQWHANAAGVDYSIQLARVGGTRVAGADFAGQVGSSGWRAEVARFAPRGKVHHSRMLLGIDHAFANSLTVTGELYFNGAGTRGRRYAGMSVGYEITPLLKLEAEAIANLADRSRYVGAALAWSSEADMEIRAGFQHFSGRAGTEFRAVPGGAYVQLRRYS